MLSRGGAGITTAPGVSFQGSIISADAWIPQKREPLWAVKAKDQYATSYTPLSSGAIIFCSTYYGIVYCVNPDGTTKWVWRASEWMPVADTDIRFIKWFSPIVDDTGTVYVADWVSGYLIAITRDGKMKWAHKLDNCTAYWGLWIDDSGFIYVASGDDCAGSGATIFVVNKNGKRVAQSIDTSEDMFHFGGVFGNYAVVWGMSGLSLYKVDRRGIVAKISGLPDWGVGRPVKVNYAGNIAIAVVDASTSSFLHLIDPSTFTIISTISLVSDYNYGTYWSNPTTVPISPNILLIPGADWYDEGDPRFEGRVVLALDLSSRIVQRHSAMFFDIPGNSRKSYADHSGAAVKISQYFTYHIPTAHKPVSSFDGVVVVNAYGDDGTIPMGQREGGLIIFNGYGWEGSASRTWLYDLPLDETHPTIAGNRIYVTSYSNPYLLCFDFEAHLIWAYRLPFAGDPGSGTDAVVVPI